MAPKEEATKIECHCMRPRKSDAIYIIPGLEPAIFVPWNKSPFCGMNAVRGNLGVNFPPSYGVVLDWDGGH